MAKTVDGPPIYDHKAMDKKCVRVTMYSLKEFPESLRQELLLKSDPYQGDTETLKYLADLGVIHYRDNLRGYGFLVPHAIDYSEEYGFPAYKNQLYLTGKFKKDPIAPAQWLFKKNYSPVIISREITRRQEKYGDALAWEVWNQAVTVYELTPNVVRCG